MKRIQVIQYCQINEKRQACKKKKTTKHCKTTYQHLDTRLMDHSINNKGRCFATTREAGQICRVEGLGFLSILICLVAVSLLYMMTE